MKSSVNRQFLPEEMDTYTEQSEAGIWPPVSIPLGLQARGDDGFFNIAAEIACSVLNCKRQGGVGCFN